MAFRYPAVLTLHEGSRYLCEYRSKGFQWLHSRKRLWHRRGLSSFKSLLKNTVLWLFPIIQTAHHESYKLHKPSAYHMSNLTLTSHNHTKFEDLKEHLRYRHLSIYLHKEEPKVNTEENSLTLKSSEWPGSISWWTNNNSHRPPIHPNSLIPGCSPQHIWAHIFHT